MSDPDRDAGSAVHVQPDGYTIVPLRGEIDVSNWEAMRAEIEAALRCPQPIIVDLAAVTFMDSSGVRAITLTLDSDELRERVTFVNLSTALVSLFRITGLDGVFAIE